MVLPNAQRHRKKAWTEAEDKILAEYINKHGACNWISISNATGLDRDGKSCRERWVNHLHPDINKGPFTKEEEDLIVQLQATHGNSWSLITTKLPGRAERDIKNYWYGMQRRKRRKVSTLNNKEENQAKLQLNSSGLSPVTSMVPTSYPLNHSTSSSHSGLLNTNESQHLTNPIYMSHYSEHFNSNKKHPFLHNFLSDSVPVHSSNQFGPSNYCINSHPNVKSPLMHSHPGVTSASTTPFPKGWYKTGSETTTSNKDKGTSIHDEGMMNIQGDELMSLLNSSSSLGPLPEWNDLSY